MTIDRLGQSGDGLSGDIAVPYTLPGEIVEASVTGNDGKLIRLLTASPVRTPAPCPHFGHDGDRCGGCHLQHLGLEASLLWKRDRLVAMLAPVFGDLPDIETAQSPLRSRRRARLSLTRRGGGWQVGFRSRRSHDIAAMRVCEILEPSLLDAAFAIRDRAGAFLPAGVQAAELFLTLTDTGIDVDLQGVDEGALDLPRRETLAALAQHLGLARLTVEGIPLAERTAPMMAMGGLYVPMPPASFLQATAHGQAFLQAEVLAGVGDALRVADLFAGLGTFAVPLAEAGAQVDAVDLDGAAIAGLGAMARRAGLPLTATARDLFDAPLRDGELAVYDAMVLDPPRAGAASQVQHLVSSGIERLVMVSCNPATLARDLRALSSHYALERLSLLDQFLWAPHIECVATLRRR